MNDLRLSYTFYKETEENRRNKLWKPKAVLVKIIKY